MSDAEVSLDLFAEAELPRRDADSGSADSEGTEFPEPRLWTISQINQVVRRVLEESFGQLWVTGEVANWTRARSGHCYFTLKDERAQLRAVMFRPDAARLPADPEEGMSVRAFGALTVYEARGEYQLVVRTLHDEGGEGLWRLAFERLRKKLDAEGLFAPERKRRLPAMPSCVGVVTSPTGAAIRDILHVIGRRAPWTRVVFRGTAVQGQGAAAGIAHAIGELAATGLPDVVIVGRGGGSIEDLWAFNEESVARAIAACPVPVISAVGHEVDVTISDLVADLRAPTPSAAGEAAVPDREAIEESLLGLPPRLARALKGSVGRQRVRAAEGIGRLSLGVRRRLATARQGVERSSDEVEQSMRRVIAGRRHALAVCTGRMEALSPLGTLQRGFAVPIDESGHVLRSTSEFEKGHEFRLRVVDGHVPCAVTSEPQRVEEHG